MAALGDPRALARPLARVGIALVALAAWLLWPRAVGGPPRPAVRAVLLDASASAARRSRGWNLWARAALRDEALAAAAAGEQLALVRFAADVERLQPTGAPEALLERLEAAGGEALRLRLEPPADLASVLDAALALVEPELIDPARRPGRVRLLGDGGATGPDPTPRLARLARAGVPLELVAPPAPDAPDLALAELRLPRAPAAGEPLAAAARLELRLGAFALPEEAELALEVLVDSAAGLQRRELPLALASFAPGADPGLFRATVPIALGPAVAGRTRVEARAVLRGPGALRGGDALPENDRAEAVALAAGRRLAAAVAEPGALPALRAWLEGPDRFPGLQWLFRTPDELPALAGELDLVLSFDLSHAALSPAAVEEVLRAGGGWLWCGGFALLRDWAGGSALAPLLPVDLGRAPGPERDVLLLVDGSGSMAGEPFERVKEALAELALATLPGDRLQLRFFTSVLGAPFELDARTPAERRRSLAELMRRRVPGGQTAILDSLAQLEAERAQGAAPMLALLLSDGRDRNAWQLETRAAALRRAFAAKGVELAAIATGPDADVELLRELVGPEGSLQVAEDLGELAELFQRAVHAERLREGPALRALPAAPGALAALPEAADALRAQLARPPESWPALERFALGELAPGASALWVGEEGAPLLAMQRVGAGRVAAWLSAPLPGWAPAWGGADDLLAPLFAALAGEGRARGGPWIEARSGRLELGAAPAAWPAVVRARLFAPALASAFDGSGLERELGAAPLRPPARAPDPRARRSGPLPAALAELPAGTLVRVELEDPGGGAPLAQLALRVPGPPELSSGPTRVSPTEAASDPRPAATRAPSPFGPPTLLAGLLALALAALGEPFAPRRDTGRGRAGAGSSGPADRSKSEQPAPALARRGPR